MTEMPSIAGIVKRVVPDPDPNPGVTLKLPTEDGYLEVTLDHEALEHAGYKDKIKSLEHQILGKGVKGRELRAEKSSSRNPESPAWSYTFRIAIKLKNDETLEWAVDLSTPHSSDV